LFAHNTFDVIDANHDGLVTAQEIQTFVDKANTIGMPEAGAMARLLGGTARIPTTGFQSTAVGEFPDQPDVLQRRFNFFDYAADGQLNGIISIDQLRVLAKNLLPAPDAFSVTDRQRASADAYLLSTGKFRDYNDLQHILPSYAFVPPRVIRRFRNISPARFGVGRNMIPGTEGPIYTLFDQGSGSNSKQKKNTATSPAAANGGTAGTTQNSPGGSIQKTSSSLPSQGSPIASGGSQGSTSPTAYQQSLLNAVTNLAGGSGGAHTAVGTTNTAARPITPGSPSPAGTVSPSVAAPAPAAAAAVHTQVVPSAASSGTAARQSTAANKARGPAIQGHPLGQSSALPKSSTKKDKNAFGSMFHYLGNFFKQHK
jgi:hypothetical protein